MNVYVVFERKQAVHNGEIEDEIHRVLEDKNTGQTLYYLQSIKGFETMLMTADKIEETEAYKSEVEG